MNKSKNFRYIQTDQRIREYVLSALDSRPIASITVSEVCNALGLNRSSFYLHYPDIYALMDTVCDEKLTELGSQYRAVHRDDPGFQPLSYLLLSARHVYDNQDFYRIYLRDRVQIDIEQHLIPLAREVMVPYFHKTAQLTEREAFYNIQFYNSGVLSVFRKWLMDGCPESPEEVVSLIGRILEMPVLIGRMEKSKSYKR